MCRVSKKKLFPTDFVMGGELFSRKEGSCQNCSSLLELSASDDLVAFRKVVEEDGSDVNEASLWYGRTIGSRRMGLEERTPLMIAALFASNKVLKYILSTGCVDVNQACGSDGATALHCAVAGGSLASPETVKILLDSSADPNSVDANGNRPADLIALGLKPSCALRKKTIELMLNGSGSHSFIEESVNQQEELQELMQTPLRDGTDKKEYPIDLTLPDINNGIYMTDEFRMYTFKVKPCSRAYSHDWTECPFVHPGENARRRDPRKYHYSCVPCPEFRKGTCRQGDACEYAHGVFESWLHPAQYRTRLCKDETGCNRRVCFFAHKPEELRPLYASTGSAVPSPRSLSANISSLEMASMSPLTLGSPSVSLHSVSPPPPMSPLAATSSPMGGGLWNQSNLVPPNLQLPGSRLKTAMNVRDMKLDVDLIALNQLHHHQKQQQQFMDEISNLSSQTNWSNSSDSRLNALTPNNLDDVFGSLDPGVLSQLRGLSQNMNQQQVRASYPSNLSSSPMRMSSFGLESPRAMTAAAAMKSRSAAFANRSQSFTDRGPVSRHPGRLGSSANATNTLSGWGSPTGKLDWGLQGEELNKLRKSASFGLRNSNISSASPSESRNVSFPADEPDVSWVQSLVKDAPNQVLPERRFSLEKQQQQKQYQLQSRGLDNFSPFVDQLYMEQEQMVA